MTHHDKAPERIWAWNDETPTEKDKSWSACDAGTGSVEYVRADLITALAEENRRLREALRRAYDHVLKDAPNWFETGSHEQRALEVERQVARAALSSGEVLP